MIILEDVYKRYIVERVPGKWILQGVSLVIPPKACVGLIGNKDAGKSTLLRIIDGTESPTEGKVERNGRVVTPMKYNKNFQPFLSGRQNSRFICRINGCSDDMEARLSHIEKLAGLGAKFDKPVNTYTAPMKSSLSFALSMAFDFDMYISDGFNFSNTMAFKDKDAVDAALKNLIEHAGIIMTVPGARGEATLKRYCKAGIWLHEGKATWFDDINDAIEAHRASQPAGRPQEDAKQQPPPVPEQASPILARIRKAQDSLAALSKGLRGLPATAPEKMLPRLIQVAKDVGMELATMEQISAQGYRVRENMIPILHGDCAGGQRTEYFDLKTQCEKIMLPPQG